MEIIRRRRCFQPANPLYVRPWTRRGGFAAHGHDFIELVLITRGAGVQVRQGGEDDLRPGDLLVVRPGEWHAYRHGGSLSGIDCCFDPVLLQHELAWTADDPGIARLLWRDAAAGALRVRQPRALSATTRTHLRALRRLDVLGPERRAERIGRLVCLLAAMARLLPGGAGAGGPRIHPAAAGAVRLMESDPAAAWTLSGLALRLGVTSTYLCRVFARDLGAPPLAWLARRRLRTAQGLLLRPGATVAAVGARVGWSDPVLFARHFRHETGLSPSAWRARFAVQ